MRPQASVKTPNIKLHLTAAAENLRFNVSPAAAEGERLRYRQVWETLLDWKAKIADTYLTRGSFEPPARPSFRSGASEDTISRLEESINCRLPMKLRSLLLQTDGVTEEIEVERNIWIEASIVIFSADQMIDTNLTVRREYSDRNVDRYCFFSTAGADGVLFGWMAASERREDAEVFAWYPDETPDKHIADGLLTFLTSWCTGRITV